MKNIDNIHAPSLVAIITNQMECTKMITKELKKSWKTVEKLNLITTHRDTIQCNLLLNKTKDHSSQVGCLH